jgi:hypothetical protein
MSLFASILLVYLVLMHCSTGPASAYINNSTSTVAAATTGAAAAAASPFRVFIDDGFFLPGETEILRAFISSSSGRLEVSGESTGAFLSFKGYYNPDK